MNILDLPEFILINIFDHLKIKNLVKSSEVCKSFNFLAKKIKSKDQQNELENIFGLNMFFDILPKLNKNNYITVSKAWNNLLFFISIDYKKEGKILEIESPSNIIFNIDGVEIIDIKKVHPSIKFLDCPLKVLSSNPRMSDTLVYLNMTEQLHILSHINFSSKSLKYLDLSFCDLLNVDLNFSKNLKNINMMGVINLYSLIGFEYVEKLNIDYCEDLTDLTPLKNVEVLTMRYTNNIKEIPFLKKLKILDISFSSVRDISKAINLKKIFLQGIEKLHINLNNYNYMSL